MKCYIKLKCINKEAEMSNINDFSMEFFSLKGKNAIVTGGCSGLGQSFSLALAKAGANIFCFAAENDNGETKK